MKTKIGFLIIGIILIALSISISTTAAQEPTQEPGSVVVVSEDETETIPPADVVVIQPEVVQPVQEKDTIAGIIEKLTVPIIAVGGFIMLMLSAKNREKTLGVAEIAEDIATAAALGANEIVAALGGNPNIVVSTDPAVLAKALKVMDKHVLIREGVSFDAVVKEYTTPT